MESSCCVDTEFQAWLEAVPTELKGKIIQLPKREDVTAEINEQLIIELCSK